MKSCAELLDEVEMGVYIAVLWRRFNLPDEMKQVVWWKILRPFTQINLSFTSSHFPNVNWARIRLRRVDIPLRLRRADLWLSTSRSRAFLKLTWQLLCRINVCPSTSAYPQFQTNTKHRKYNYPLYERSLRCLLPAFLDYLTRCESAEVVEEKSPNKTRQIKFTVLIQVFVSQQAHNNIVQDAAILWGPVSMNNLDAYSRISIPTDTGGWASANWFSACV